MVTSTEVMLHSFLYVIEFQLCEFYFYLHLHLHRQSIKENVFNSLTCLTQNIVELRVLYLT